MYIGVDITERLRKGGTQTSSVAGPFICVVGSVRGFSEVFFSCYMPRHQLAVARDATVGMYASILPVYVNDGRVRLPGEWR